MKKWENDIWFYDFEVFAQDWLIVLNPFNNKDKWVTYHNDSEGLNEFISEHPNIIMCGYNNKSYDKYILKGCLLGYDPFVIKEINDWIITEHQQGWEYPFDYQALPPQMDLILDIVPRKSLKEIEGNLGMDITESTIEFTDERKWTKKMFEEILFYCKADVTALRPLYELRKNYIQTKVDLARTYEIDELTVFDTTNANLVAKVLGAVQYQFDPDEEYQFPTTIPLNEIPNDIIDFYKDMKPKYGYDGTLNEDASSKYDVDIVGCPHKLGFGGLHGARLNYFEEATNDRLIVNFDAFSFYPSIMLQNNHLSRGIHNAERFAEIYQERYDSKFSKDSAIPKEKIPTLKLVLNTTYGISGAKFNKVYDPLQCKSVCVDGQVSLIYLIMKLSAIDSIIHIQSNTDGIMFSVDKKDYKRVKNIVADFEKQTGFIMEEDRIEKVCQRDVNNYLIVMEGGKIKSKGKIFSALNKASYEAGSLAIVSEAVTKYFVEGIPVKDTIMECNDPIKFQMIEKSGSTYDGGCLHEVNGEYVKAQRCNRIVAGKDKTNGKVYKIKLQDEEYRVRTSNKKLTDYMLNKKGWYYMGEDEETGKFIYHEYLPKYDYLKNKYIIKRDTVADCPDHALIVDNIDTLDIDNIDKMWYIKYTEKIITKFEGGNSMPKKAENKVNVEELVTEGAEITSVPKQTISSYEDEKFMGWLKKYHAMRLFITEAELKADGYNSHQSYEYVKGDTYRELLNDACIASDMEYILSIHNADTIDIPSETMHLTRIQGAVMLIDLDTGFSRWIPVIADGTDNMDKGLYKAETMMIKAFVQTNFLKGRTMDAEDGNGYTKPTLNVTSNKPMTASERGTVKSDLINDDKASAEYLDKIVDAVLKIRKVDADYLTGGELEPVNDETITQLNAVSLYCEIEEKADELNVEL